MHTAAVCCPLQPITKDELSAIAGPAAMHAIGHVAANLSFAAVAISLTHTVKTLEPAFNVVLSKVGCSLNHLLASLCLSVLMLFGMAPLFHVTGGNLVGSARLSRAHPGLCLAL